VQNFSLHNEYKERYLRELSRRNEIIASLAMPNSIVAALFSATLYLVSRLHLPFILIDYMQLCLLGAALICLLFAVYKVVRALIGYENASEPTPFALEKWRQDLYAYYVAENITISDQEIEKEVLNYLYGEYAKNAELNAKNNEERMIHLNWANRSILISFVFIAFCATINVAVSFSTPATVYDVRVIDK